MYHLYLFRSASRRKLVATYLSLVLTCSSLCFIPLKMEAEETTDELIRLGEKSDRLHRSVKQLLVRLKEHTDLEIIRKRNKFKEDIEEWRSNDKIDGKEFNAKFEEALAIGFHQNGLDPARMRRFYSILKKTILRSDFEMPDTRYAEEEPTTLQAFVDYFDLAGQTQKEISRASAKRQEYRVQLFKSTALIFFEALIEPDADVALSKFQRLRNAISTIQGADTMALTAEADAILATQTLVRDIVSGVPVAGELFDLHAMVTGEDLAGERLAGWERAVGLLLIVPAVGDIAQIARRNPGVAKALGQLSSSIKHASSTQLGKMAVSWKKSPGDLTKLSNSLGSVPEVNRYSSKLDNDILQLQSELTVKKFDGTLEGQKAAADWVKVQREGKAKVEELSQSVSGWDGQALTPEILASYQKVRMDKQAVKALKDSGEFSELRGPVSDIEAKLFGKTDALGKKVEGSVDLATFDAVKNDLAEGVAKLAENRTVLAEAGEANHTIKKLTAIPKKQRTPEVSAKLEKARHQANQAKKKLHNLSEGEQAALRLENHIRKRVIESAGDAKGFNMKDFLDPKSAQIEVMNVSNSPTKYGSIGSDRDLTYQIVLKNGEKVDVPADLVRKHYNQKLYEALNPGGKKLSPKKLKRYGLDMDHMVTDRQHAEAYLLRDGLLDDVVGEGGKAGKRLSIEDSELIAETFKHKGYHWLEEAAEARRLKKTGEAMAFEAEAMRQITKQYKNIVLTRLKREELSPEEFLPPKAVEAFRIMTRVENDRSYSPEHAKAALKGMGLDLESAFELMADSLVRIERKGVPASGGLIHKGGQ